jgi:hypothetical protein
MALFTFMLKIVLQLLVLVYSILKIVGFGRARRPCTALSFHKAVEYMAGKP